MPRLVRSPFPVPPTTPSAHQLDLFANTVEDSSLVEGPVVVHRTAATRRWSIVEDWSARDDADAAADIQSTAANDAHRSRDGRLSRPRHATKRARAATQTIGAEGATCGRSDRAERTGATTSRGTTLDVVTGFEAPVAVPREEVVQQPAAPASPRIRRVVVRSTGSGTGAATVRSEPLRSSLGIEIAPAQPAWSCATTWLRSIEKPGEGRTRSTTAAASYAFIAAMLACTFLV